MSLDIALRLTEILLALAFLQQGVEHLQANQTERRLFWPRILLSLLLLTGLASPWVCFALLLHSARILYHFQGPYNGGSDRMSLLILCCLCLTHFAPTLFWQEMAFGYLAFQLLLSYFMAGWVKVKHAEWRSGQALTDVFAFSSYPVSENLRDLANRPKLLKAASWAVMGFELLFPFSLLSQTSLIIGLSLAALFHLSNAWLFGLNRFFWCWLAAYPALIWLQHRLFMSAL